MLLLTISSYALVPCNNFLSCESSYTTLDFDQKDLVLKNISNYKLEAKEKEERMRDHSLEERNTKIEL